MSLYPVCWPFLAVTMAVRHPWLLLLLTGLSACAGKHRLYFISADKVVSLPFAVDVAKNTDVVTTVNGDLLSRFRCPSLLTSLTTTLASLNVVF